MKPSYDGRGLLTYEGYLRQRHRVRVKAPTRLLGAGVPDDARPGDLVVGNRGAAARVVQPLSQFGGLAGCLVLEYVGNWYGGYVRTPPENKVYDSS